MTTFIKWFSVVFCLLSLCSIGKPVLAIESQQDAIFTIGASDNRPDGFALASDSYHNFLENDFGWEDKFFLVNHSKADTNWPYVLPGPADSWGGTGPTAGIRSHVLNLLFDVRQKISTAPFDFLVDIVGYNRDKPPLVKISINGHSQKFQLNEGGIDSALVGDYTHSEEHKIKIPVPLEWIKIGGNTITITTLQGSWLVFDQILLIGKESVQLEAPDHAFVRNIEAAKYEIKSNKKRYQPLLVDIQHLEGEPDIQVLLDGNKIFEKTLIEHRYKFEAPMPAVDVKKTSNYEILINGISVRKGKVLRNEYDTITPADYVDTMMGAGHSRWMIAPGPWMPFSMVKLSPDNQNSGWQSGYDPTFESIGTFSHIHEWTMSGLGMLPVNGPLQLKTGDEKDPDSGYRSRIDKSTEEAPLGHYKVELDDYNIKAQVTATTRAGFQKYTYPEDTTSRVMIDLKIPAEYEYQLKQVEIKKVNNYRIEGYSEQYSPDTWSGGVDQEYTIYFVLEFDKPITHFGVWQDDRVSANPTLRAINPKDAGAFAEFDTRKNQVIQVRSGISLVSLENASQNLQQEITDRFGWNFDEVVAHQKAVWNDILGRIKINSHDQHEKRRFYSNFYRSIASRNTWSDVNGEWVDATEKVRKLHDPDAVALGCDAFWNTFWNLNQLWNLVTPEWSSRWVKSQLAMYDANGWLAKGPAGMEYIPVMVAEHEIPLIVGAYQMGIRNYDVEKAFEAVYHNQTSLPEKVGGGLAGNRDLAAYLKHKYVPYDTGRFSNTLEYSFDDWTVSQFAKSLGKEKEYKEFKNRGEWWKHAIDQETGYARMKDSDGIWLKEFDPFHSGSNKQYVEGNAWQLTYFVPQNVPGLIQMIGKERFVERLNWGFEQSYTWRFNAPNDQYWDFPVIQGNQQSMHFAYLFNWADHPWLTQKWSRAIMERYYGYGVSNAYLGDEDQGQMSAWFVMSAMGLFQTDGGTRSEPVYEISSPIFERIEIDLGNRFGRANKFVIEAKDVSRKNKYIQSATLNGEPLYSFKFPAHNILNGGNLTLEMGPSPNKEWGL